ncbi:PIR Superfamily Protein [Plasmodium ovale curtisi]|uniref:PIR Superfamily Protein n=1 Tax=Plasmodium ovale curtisi TaxID=864141 RepID=A0A1A8X8X2_PLAOA|nr:PIR Superfamily Protein [Plasmodium ovale curtisi]SBT00714.1 PIR Superfamily Protein [Plasmodium ovale curtisi]
MDVLTKPDSYTEKIDMSAWYNKFIENLKFYYNDISNTWNSDNQSEGCRDFFYHISQINDYVKKEKTNKIVNDVMLDTITTCINNLFSNSSELGCKGEFFALTNIVYARKNLDYFCENRNFMQKSLNEKFNCLDCI